MNLFPFTLTRDILEIRMGIVTIAENSNGKNISHPWDIFLQNNAAIREDFAWLTAGRVSAPLPASVTAIEPGNIFVEEGARLSCCVLNASEGPIYIGRNTEVMEGALIRGPFALCEGAVVKMGAKIYGATTIGPYCSVGGEIKNSVFFGYSNKSHEGYLGDSVIGEWCNLGAGSSNSNVKNDAGDIKVWNHPACAYVSSGLMKCGLLMGDYSRSAINSSFNTGSITGVCANIFGSGLLPKYIPSFAWGVGGEYYRFERALEHIENWKRLKGHELSEKEKRILKLIFEQK